VFGWLQVVPGGMNLTLPQVINSDATDHALSRMSSMYFQPMRCFMMMH
jgi:hypothetical protein